MQVKHFLPMRCDIDWIQVHVAAQLEYVFVFVNHGGTIPSLHQMTTLLVSAIEIDRISRLQTMHELAQVPARGV
jgi:hypothetical protein